MVKYSSKGEWCTSFWIMDNPSKRTLLHKLRHTVNFRKFLNTNKYENKRLLQHFIIPNRYKIMNLVRRPNKIVQVYSSSLFLLREYLPSLLALRFVPHQTATIIDQHLESRLVVDKKTNSNYFHLRLSEHKRHDRADQRALSRAAILKVLFTSHIILCVSLKAHKEHYLRMQTQLLKCEDFQGRTW